MSSLHIAIVHPDDDHLRIEANGETIASANHDEHGWSGMDAVEKTARAIAEAAGLDVSEHWGEEDTEEASA